MVETGQKRFPILDSQRQPSVEGPISCWPQEVLEKQAGNYQK